MRIQNIIRLTAGSLIIISVVLGFFMNKYLLIIAFLVGLNLFQYGITNWCLLESLLRKIGIKE